MNIIITQNNIVSNLLLPIKILFRYLLSRNAAAPDLFPFGKSGNEPLNRPHLLDTVDTVGTVLNPMAVSTSPPITTATSKISIL